MERRKIEPIDKLIDDISREKNRLLSSFIEKYSLGNGQLQILHLVAWDEGISQENVARLRDIDKSAVGKSVKRLIENDYIYKIKDEKDKRAYCLYCTKKGLEIIPKIGDLIQKLDEILIKDSTKEEIDLFKKIIKRMNKNIKDYSNSN